MSRFTNSKVGILGIAGAVPKNIVKVDDYVGVFGSDVVEKFKKNTGINFVHRTSCSQTASDLGYVAADNVINLTKVERKNIGILIFVSQSPDYRKPATACVLQHRLNLEKDCASFDINLGCSGFVYGHQIISSLLSTSNAEYGLLIVGETSSKLVNEKDKSTAMMFGDAGAAILYAKCSHEKEEALLCTDGSRFKTIIVPSGGFRDMNPIEKRIMASDGMLRSKFESYMDGVGVFSFSMTDVSETVKNYLDYKRKCINDYDFIVFHQANKMIIKQFVRKFKIKEDKVLFSLDEYGNTSGVSIPLTLCKGLGSVSCGVFKVLAVGYGIGLSWGCTEFTVDASKVFTIIETNDCFLEGVLSSL